MKVYTIDKSKLIKIGQSGYVKGQEQAKQYFDYLPSGKFTVEVVEKEEIESIFKIANIEDGALKKILIDVDYLDKDCITITIYYQLKENDAPTCYLAGNEDIETKIYKYIKGKMEIE